MAQQRFSATLWWSATIAIAAVLVACSGGGKTSAVTPQRQAPPALTRSESNIDAGGVAPEGALLRNPHGSAADAIKAGEGLFASMNCDGCHGGGGSGFVGPSLADGRWRYGGSDPEVFASIFYGRPKGMPAFGGAIGSDGIWMMVSYLKSLAPPSTVPTQSWIEPAKATAPSGPASAPAAANAPATAPLGADASLGALIKKNGCTACHAVDHKVIGPSYQDVAKRYRERADAPQKLAQSVRNGSVEEWDEIPMPPNATLAADELDAIIKGILALQ